MYLGNQKQSRKETRDMHHPWTDLSEIIFKLGRNKVDPCFLPFWNNCLPTNIRNKLTSPNLSFLSFLFDRGDFLLRLFLWPLHRLDQRDVKPKAKLGCSTLFLFEPTEPFCAIILCLSKTLKVRVFQLVVTWNKHNKLRLFNAHKYEISCTQAKIVPATDFSTYLSTVFI